MSLKELNEYTGVERNLIGLFGIDAGNYDTKSRHNTFTSGLTLKRVRNCLSNDFIQFSGSKVYYVLSSEPNPAWENKTESEDMFVMTMFAIAKEALARGISICQKEEIVLSIGMPPGDFNKANVEKYKQYYESRKNVSFNYGDTLFDFVIESVVVTAQCWGAAAQYSTLIKDYDEVLLCDIGGLTTDNFKMTKVDGSQKIDSSSIVSKGTGIKTLLNKIANGLRDLSGLDMQFSQVNGILKGTRKPFGLVEKDFQLISDLKYEFVDELFTNIRMNGDDLKILPIVFLGGGAALLENEIKEVATEQKACEYKIIKDSRANAIGYETIAAAGKYHISKKTIDAFWNDFESSLSDTN